MEVRSVRDEDVDQCVELGKLMWAESPVFSSHELDTDKFKSLAGMCLHDDAFMGFVAIHDDRVVGFWAGSIQSFWYSDDRIIRDFVFYVDLNFRGTSAAYRLIRAVEMWAKSSGVSEIGIGLSSLVDIEKTTCFFDRMGYSKQIIVFNKNV
jgi:GNAT superfamily N-acetyltransferase